MAIFAGEMVDYMTHGLHGRMDSRIPHLAMLNDSGRHFTDMHSWRFLRRRSAQLDLRGPIKVNDCTWSESALTLTKVGAFAGYVFTSGDTLQVSDGTGIPDTTFNLTNFVIVSKTDDVLTLEKSIGATDAAADIDIQIIFDYIKFPTTINVKQVEDLEPTDNLLNTVALVTPEFLQEHRSNASAISPFGFFVTFSNSEVLGAYETRLEIWPVPASDHLNFITLWYTSGWTNITDDNARVPIPEYCETLFKQLVRAFAKGYEEEEFAALGERLLAIETSTFALHAKRRDGGFFPNVGKPHGSKVQEMSFDRFLGSSPTVVPAPA